MIQVQAFRCTDGTIKTSKFEALTYERNLKLKDIVNKNMGNNNTMMTAAQAAAIIGNNFKRIEEIYKECDRQLNHMASLQRRREKDAEKKANKVKANEVIAS
jgi:hypothetical protein